MKYLPKYQKIFTNLRNLEFAFTTSSCQYQKSECCDTVSIINCQLSLYHVRIKWTNRPQFLRIPSLVVINRNYFCFFTRHWRLTWILQLLDSYSVTDSSYLNWKMALTIITNHWLAEITHPDHKNIHWKEMLKHFEETFSSQSKLIKE